MQVSTKNRAEAGIHQRREKDQRVTNLQSKLKQEFHQKSIAQWEQKGDMVEQRKIYQNRLSQLRAQANQRIQQRRQLLGDLLAREHQQYVQEIKDKQETPDQVRQRMLDQVAALKSKKEKANKEYVEKQLDRKFVLGADELRKVDQEFKEMKFMYERNIQMMEKQQHAMIDFDEEMIYAELYKREIRRKELEDAQDREIQKAKREEVNQIQDYQRRQNEFKQAHEKQLYLQERQMLNEEWQKDKFFVQQREHNNFLHQKELQRQIMEENERQRTLKRQHQNQELKSDKVFVQSVIAREQEQDRLEQEEKERQKVAQKKFLQNFKNRAGELRSQEAELEKLIEQQNQQYWDKKQAVWDKENEARIRLLYQTYEARAQDLQLKKDIQAEEMRQSELEKQAVTQDILQNEKEIQMKQLKQEEINQKYRESLSKQIEFKKEEQLKKLQQKAEEEKAERIAEIQYQKRIQDQKNKGAELLEQLRKQRPF